MRHKEGDEFFKVLRCDYCGAILKLKRCEYCGEISWESYPGLGICETYGSLKNFLYDIRGIRGSDFVKIFRRYYLDTDLFGLLSKCTVSNKDDLVLIDDIPIAYDIQEEK